MVAERPETAEASFRDLFERNPIPMFMYEREGLRIIDSNDAAAAQYGYSRTAFSTMTVRDLAPETAAPDEATGLQRHRKSDGTRIDVEVARLDLVHAGMPASLITAIDVTEKLRTERLLSEKAQQVKKMAEDLLQSQQHLSLAQQIAQIGSFERDLSTGAVIWSAETYRILGCDPATPALPRNQYMSIVHPEDRARYESGMKASEQGVNPDPIDYRIVRPDGSIRWIHTIAATITDADGRPWRRIGTLQDVTELREAQEQQRRLEQSLRVAKEAADAATLQVQAANADLEHRVHERTALLESAQQELVKKERLSAIGQVTATVAHELRNPLSALRNTVFALKEAADANQLQLARPLGRMERSIARCEHIIADLLDFTRSRELRPTTVRIDDWCSEVLDEQKLPDGIVLERRLNAPGAVASLDEDRFRRVVINLIENAAQAFDGADRSERRIIVSTGATPYPTFEIEDTGPGISPGLLPKIFEPLFSTKSFGTGLGLPTVKQIVEQHGGTIVIESEVGRGTRVSIRLPPPASETAAA
jgi:PAS domain S-box-containing protein